MSFSLSDIPAEQLFEVPMDVLDFANPEEAMIGMGKKSKKSQKKDNNNTKAI